MVCVDDDFFHIFFSLEENFRNSIPAATRLRRVWKRRRDGGGERTSGDDENGRGREGKDKGKGKGKQNVEPMSVDFKGPTHINIFCPRSTRHLTSLAQPFSPLRLSSNTRGNLTTLLHVAFENRIAVVKAERC